MRQRGISLKFTQACIALFALILINHYGKGKQHTKEHTKDLLTPTWSSLKECVE